MKKFITIILVLTLVLMFVGVNVGSSSGLQPLPRTNGPGNVTYRGTSVEVMIPTEYTVQDQEFRGVWVTPLVGDIGLFLNDQNYKRELISVLDTMERYNMNAIVFHLRIMNDALYDTDLSPRSPYILGSDFERWDYLEWFIEETHSRGMEFHAWLNPYRISASAITMDTILSRYRNFPDNPASQEEYVLLGNGNAILNPGEPRVREFVIDSVMEIIEKYDVDAIHFDDYFYASMPANADSETYNKYRHNSSTTNIADWRREQVNTFIEDLSDTMRAYNQEHNRYVQLGISPTGIWRNGNGEVTYDANGTAITNGSRTVGFQHYGSYLYGDSKLWIDNEWIDYITPQSYWSFELAAAPYADVVNWWAQIVKYKDVNLYTGTGLYRHFSGDNGASWETNRMEMYNQLMYNNKYDTIDGTVIFNYRFLKQGPTLQGFNKVMNELWNTPVIPPIIKTMEPVLPGQVNEVRINKINNGFVLNWDEVENARRYAIYRSDQEVNPNDPTQLVGLIGKNTNQEIIFNDIDNDIVDGTLYNYAVVAVSATNHSGSPVFANSSSANQDVNFKFAELGNASLSGSFNLNSQFFFLFDEATVYGGSEMSYQLLMSRDNINWDVVDPKNITKRGINYSHRVVYPYSSRPFYFKLIAENELGQIESDIYVAQLDIDDINDMMEVIYNIKTHRINRILP